MNHKQVIAILAPLALMVVMYPIFRFLSRALGERLGWYFGLMTYWVIWGGLFTTLMIGKEIVLALIQPQKLTLKIALFVLFPLVMSALYRLVPGMDYEKPKFWVLLLLISTAFGNGFFEEIFWRGMYLQLFPKSILWQIIWPSILFALWHYIPGSVHSDGNVVGLMVGAGFFGFFLSFLARYTGTIWWGIIAHVLGGIIMVL